jgi:hypothetical protein
MYSKNQLTGMRGVYLVAAELARHGFIASPTSRSAQAADILATDPDCKRAWSIQVKTKVTSATYWLVTKHAKKAVAKSHFYVFVNIRDGESPEFFVIPSKKVAKMVFTYRSKNAVWFSIGEEDAKPFRDKWKLLRNGKP